MEHGASLEAQVTALVEAGQRKGYRVEVLREEGKSGASMKGRPALAEALQRLHKGEATALLANRLDRLSRSVGDFARILDTAKREGWTVCVLDADVDTSTPSGRFLVDVMCAAAAYEREILSARTREGLAQRVREGVRLGRPSRLPLPVVERITRERAAGASLRAIGAGLERDGVSTAQGGAAWYAGTVRKVLNGQDSRKVAA